MTKLLAILLFLIALVGAAFLVLADDNCCHLPGRNCQSDSEWQQGYHDFRTHQCQAPAAGQSEPKSQSVAQSEPESQSLNNCCFLGWTCTSNEQWVSGYYARQNGNACTPLSQLAQSQLVRSTSEEETQSINEWFSNAESRCDANPEQCGDIMNERLDELRENCEQIEGYTCVRGENDGFGLLGPTPTPNPNQDDSDDESDDDSCEESLESAQHAIDAFCSLPDFQEGCENARAWKRRLEAQCGG